MFVKQPNLAWKDANTSVPYEVGSGFKLASGTTYYIDVSMPDPAQSSVHCAWDANLVITSLNYQESNLPAYKSATEPYADKDSTVDVAIYDATNGNWLTQDPSTAYVPIVGAGVSVTNMTVAATGGAVGGAFFDLGNASGRRARMKIVVGATGGFFRCHCHGKQA